MERRGNRRGPRRRPRRRAAARTWPGWGWLAGEAVALLVAALVATIALLGASAGWLADRGVTARLLVFAAVVLVLGILAAAGIAGWLRVRRPLAARGARLPAAVALVLMAGALGFTTRPRFQRDVAGVRAWIGGPAEARRLTLAHQVYAAYRRADLARLEVALARARVYESSVFEAAGAYGLDPDVLMGVGFAESSFLPRDSADGGRGLFQITAPPAAAVEDARARLGVDRVDLVDPRHNAFVAAATLRTYLEQMRGDTFLGLLAFNIGPANGGLRSIMRQYGARDFVTIQPYLQHLPRDYPIRVLSAALAHRLWRAEGRLPRYEEGENALRIQRVGIPGVPVG